MSKSGIVINSVFYPCHNIADIIRYIKPKIVQIPVKRPSSQKIVFKPINSFTFDASSKNGYRHEILNPIKPMTLKTQEKQNQSTQISSKPVQVQKINNQIISVDDLSTKRNQMTMTQTQNNKFLLTSQPNQLHQSKRPISQQQSKPLKPKTTTTILQSQLVEPQSPTRKVQQRIEKIVRKNITKTATAAIRSKTDAEHDAKRERRLKNTIQLQKFLEAIRNDEDIADYLPAKQDYDISDDSDQHEILELLQKRFELSDEPEPCTIRPEPPARPDVFSNAYANFFTSSPVCVAAPADVSNPQTVYLVETVVRPQPRLRGRLLSLRQMSYATRAVSQLETQFERDCFWGCFLFVLREPNLFMVRGKVLPDCIRAVSYQLQTVRPRCAFIRLMGARSFDVCSIPLSKIDGKLQVPRQTRCRRVGGYDVERDFDCHGIVVALKCVENVVEEQ